MTEIGAPSTGGEPRCGYVALLGRPNVGKSTLLNSLVGQKISITTPKAQTTRHNIVGIRSLAETQILYLDTPGIHNRGRSALNRYLNRAAGGALNSADVVVFLVEALRWTDEDESVLQRLGKFHGPVILAVTKIDRLRDKQKLLPFMGSLGHRYEFAEILPLSAAKRDGLERLETLVAAHLPHRAFEFPTDQVTTISQRFLAAEMLREKLSLLLQAELPYSLTVEIEDFREVDGIVRIGAVVWVERNSQKGIVIGKGGIRLRDAGQRARLALERQLDARVHLEIWVRVREGWADDERALNSLGYSDN